MKKLLLKNGKQLTIKSKGYWGLLIVKIENKDNCNFCIVDGSLYTISDPEGYAEPCSPLKDEYQLNDETYNYLSKKFRNNTCSFF